MGSFLGVTINDKELSEQIRKAREANPRETVAAVNECVLDLAGNSAKRAPVDKGDLRNNCMAALNGMTIFTQQTPTGAIPQPSLTVFGSVSYSLPYALRQHEELNYKHPHGGEAKYLERPFEERKDRYINRIAEIPERITK